jgi:hypothetical protein
MLRQRFPEEDPIAQANPLRTSRRVDVSGVTDEEDGTAVP